MEPAQPATHGRSDRSSWARECLVAARAAVEADANDARGGDLLCRELSDAADQVLQTLFEGARRAYDSYLKLVPSGELADAARQERSQL